MMYVCLTQSAGIILYKMSEKSLLAQWTNAGHQEIRLASGER